MTPFDKWLATEQGKQMVARCGDLTAIHVAFNAGVKSIIQELDQWIQTHKARSSSFQTEFNRWYADFVTAHWAAYDKLVPPEQ